MKRKLSLLAPKPGSRAAIRQTIERPIVRTIDRTADGDLGDRTQSRQHASERGVIGDCMRGASKPAHKPRIRNSAAILRRESAWQKETRRWLRSPHFARVNPAYRRVGSYTVATSPSGHILGSWPIGTVQGSTFSRIIPAKEWTPDQLRIIRETSKLQITNDHAVITGDILTARAIVAEIDSRPERARQALEVTAARSYLKREAIKDAAFNARGGRFGDQDVIYRIMGRLPAKPAAAPASAIVARFRFQSVPADSPCFAFTPRVPLSALVPLARPKVMTAGRY